MPNTTNTRAPQAIALDILTEIRKAINLTDGAILHDDPARWLDYANEDAIINDIQDTLASYLDGQLQPLVDEYTKSQQLIAQDEQDTVEQAYRQAKGM